MAQSRTRDQIINCLNQAEKCCQKLFSQPDGLPEKLPLEEEISMFDIFLYLASFADHLEQKAQSERLFFKTWVAAWSSPNIPILGAHLIEGSNCHYSLEFNYSTKHQIPKWVSQIEICLGRIPLISVKPDKSRKGPEGINFEKGLITIDYDGYTCQFPLESQNYLGRGKLVVNFSALLYETLEVS